MARADQELEWFHRWMKHKINSNEHKECWKELTFLTLVGMLYEECEEMERALDNYIGAVVHDEPIHAISSASVELIKECADVSNFSMFIADKAYTEYKDKMEEFMKKVKVLDRKYGPENKDNNPIAMPYDREETDAESFQRHIMSSVSVPNLTDHEEYERFNVSEFCMSKHGFGYLYYTWISFRDGSIYTKDNIEPKG